MKDDYIFIVEDDDTGECHVFKYKPNAIKFMLDKCKEWGALLYIAVKDYRANNFYQYTSFDKVYDTDEKKLNYLLHCSQEEINDIFESYWYYQECLIEDAD